MASDTSEPEGATEEPAARTREPDAAPPAAPAPRRGAGRWSDASGAVPSMVEGAQQAAVAVGQGTRSALVTVGKGLQRAAHALEAPPSTELDALLPGADLPELSGGDALAALALRLDREADLWRSLALRSLARAAWADRLTHLAALCTLVGSVALATIAALGALWGSAQWGSRVGLLGAGAALLALGALLVGHLAQRVRRGETRVAEASLARADRAEARLHRVGVTMALRAQGPRAERDALTRLEWDVLG